MRQPHRVLLLLLALTVGLGVLGARPALADDRAEAKAHYQAGQKAYASGDYKVAIKEFSTAQQLVPADLNNYNLALCYDKLGDPEPAVQYYREYLNKVPTSDKRAEIEASIARLDSAAKSVAAKKADEQKKIDDARKADDAKKAAEAKHVDDAAKAKKPDTADVAPPVEAPKADDGAALGSTLGANAGGGSTGTPGSGQVVTTGDAQLDRVQALNISALRDQRTGGTSGIVDQRGAGPNGAPPNGAAAGAPPNGAPPNGAPPNTAAGMAPPGPNGAPPNGMQGTASGQPLPSDKPTPAETPIYKKWWFWAVVAVTAYVAIEIVTQSSNAPKATGREQPLDTRLPGHSSLDKLSQGGLTLLRF